MKSLYYLSLVILMSFAMACNQEAEVITFVELSEVEKAENFLSSAPSRVLFGKATFESNGDWTAGWIINKWGQVRELDLSGFEHFGMSDFMFQDQLNDMNDSSRFLYEIEDAVSLAEFYKKMELRFKGLKATAGEAYFSYHLDQSDRFSSTGGCNIGSDGPLVAFDMSIISMNGELANAPSAASCVQWLRSIDQDLEN